MPKINLDKAYLPQNFESQIYEKWESQGYFTATIRKDRKPFVIMMPPPNVTGMLTLGHVLNNSIQDILIRWHRMKGEDTLWLPGMDHAGIATQIKVEEALRKEGLTRHDLGREKLVERIWEWKEQYGGIILKQLRKLGASCDWSRERFTLDEGLSRAVATIFVHLYKKGLIYRGKRIVNWDPVSQTALSDEQVEYRNVSSHLWHLRYPLSDGSGYLVVATTRPETMLGDSAVAVHPEDERYKHLHGKNIKLPIVGREIPIIADNFVDSSFGTGCVKVTPAHDPNDFDMGKRHNLEFITVIAPDGKMTDDVPAEFKNLSREAARKLVVQKFEELELLDKIEPYSHSVGHNERTGTVIEPLLSEQWFVSMKSMADMALEAVRSEKVRFHPEHWEKTYFHWLENVRDWCISRQIWWGHRIPLWTVKETGEIICSVDDPTNDPKYKGLTLEQDPDVVDTWFSSWLWPFSTLGWPDETQDIKHFFPSTVLVTAPDIIFLWVARMIMASEEVFGVEPYQDVYYTGIVRDMRGRKMSKSLGNSPDPIEVIDTYGADALRYSIISLTPRGGDIRFGSELSEMGRNFANKLWNAARFVMMNLPEEGEEFHYTPVDSISKKPDNLIDQWITSAFFTTAREANVALEKFHFSEFAKRLYSFIWNDYCDWYLELIKTRLSEGTAEEKKQTLQTALGILDGILRLLHPVMPFITEEIYQQLRKLSESSWSEVYRCETIMKAPYPMLRCEYIDETVEDEFTLLQDAVNSLRNLRGELNIPKSTKMKAHAIGGTIEQKEFLISFTPFINKLAGLESFEFMAHREKGSSSSIVHGIEIAVPLANLIDLKSEESRLAKEQDRLTKVISGTQAKLNNADFVARAKEEIVEAEKQKLADLEHALEKISRSFSEIQAINSEA